MCGIVLIEMIGNSEGLCCTNNYTHFRSSKNIINQIN